MRYTDKRSLDKIHSITTQNTMIMAICCIMFLQTGPPLPKTTISTGSIKFSTWLALELRYHNWKQMLLEYNWPVLIFKKYIIEQN